MGTYVITVWEGPDGVSPFEVFLATLEGPCLGTAQTLWRLIENQGTRLTKKKSKNLGDGLWELKGKCPAGGVRLYYWQSGRTEFTMVAGEVKKEDDGDQKLIAFAKECKREFERKRAQESARAATASPQRRRRNH